MAYYFPYLVIIFFLNINVNKTFKMPGNDTWSHLKFKSVSKSCSHRDDFCRSTDPNVCTVKRVKQKNYYKDFENGCYLFLSNMCDHPEEEYFIADTGSCKQYLTARREEPKDVPTATRDDEAGNNTDSTKRNSDDNDTVTEAGALREKPDQGVPEFTRLYSVSESFDGDPCPFSCPNIYSPVCINVNRGFGEHFKMMTFVNHCSADIYYCKNPTEFPPPPEYSSADINISPLSWSYCGANRYMQFARFSEAASSMGHFGWLAGDYKYSHIMEPHQRIPGYG